jgi:hypothetical protein
VSASDLQLVGWTTTGTPVETTEEQREALRKAKMTDAERRWRTLAIAGDEQDRRGKL